MKEFVSQTGGRYTYIDDILNLQELSLAFSHIFDGCGDFIISGCDVTGTTINPGFVFINNKIRYCAGTTGASKWPMYIYESNKSEKVSYADSLDKAGREIYGCALGSVVPNIVDAITGKLPKSIKIEQNGSTSRLKDSFFGKYSLLLNPSTPSQSVNKPVTFNNELFAEAGITAKHIDLFRGNSNGKVYINEEGNLVFQCTTTNNSKCKITITDSQELHYYVNDILVASFNQQGNYLKHNVKSEKITGGNVSLSDSNMFNEHVSTNEASLNINMIGYHAGHQFFRNTNIGDGKGNVIVKINGLNKNIDFNGNVNIRNAGASLTLTNPLLTHTDNALINCIKYCDKNSSQMAVVGFSKNNDKHFYIENSVGNIVINNNTYITGELYVGATNVMNALVSKTQFNETIKEKANVIDVYNKNIADETFVKKTDSISVFVKNAGSKDLVCKELGACTTTEYDGTVKKSEAFKDIAAYGLPDNLDITYHQKLEERQRALCSAIGAAYKDDVAKTQKDTGWIAIEVGCSFVSKIYVRQVGCVVSIQGELHTHHSGVIFTLPNSVDPPKYKIGYSHNKSGEWHCTIEGGKRDCVVDYCNSGCSEYIGFLMTYLV